MTVLPGEDGLRLDAVLARLLPGTGLRGRRRLCGSAQALVNGRPQKAAFKVRAGDEIALADEAVPAFGAVSGGCGASLILRTEHMAFLNKPAGLHCAALAGKNEASLEAMLPALLPDDPAACLLNRLDLPTSGIVAAALDEEGKALYRSAQLAGKTEKRYLAVLEGTLLRPMEARLAICQDGRRRVRVLFEESGDPARRTHFVPLCSLDGAGGLYKGRLTIAGCVIYRGARHQIRAHAAALGFPLLGDTLYGGPPLPDRQQFFLHHGALIMPHSRVAADPPEGFPLPQELRGLVLQWLRK